MACATPLVVSRAGAIPEVVGPDGECADLVTPGDVGELARAIARLLDDPERRARMGAAGRRRGRESFSWLRRAGGRGVRGGGRLPPGAGRSGRVLTVDFDRLGVRARDQVLDRRVRRWPARV
ncbi:MAG: glycosyltransferase [Nocardioides sp.]